jgi:hypothetical protein
MNFHEITVTSGTAAVSSEDLGYDIEQIIG